MRATFLAGGKAIDRGVVDDVRSIDLAPTAAFLLDVPVPETRYAVREEDFLNVFGAGVALPLIGTISYTPTGTRRRPLLRDGDPQPRPASPTPTSCSRTAG